MKFSPHRWCWRDAKYKYLLLGSGYFDTRDPYLNLGVKMNIDAISQLLSGRRQMLADMAAEIFPQNPLLNAFHFNIIRPIAFAVSLDVYRSWIRAVKRLKRMAREERESDIPRQPQSFAAFAFPEQAIPGLARGCHGRFQALYKHAE